MAAGDVQQSSPWILGFSTVCFDVDLGQQLSFLYPDGVLSQQERMAVAFHAFPDSMSMELHARNSIRDSSFLFRVPRGNGTWEGSATPVECSGHSQHESQQRFLYGFVFCRQRQDERLRRGGEQASVVILSEQPLSAVLSPLSQLAGPAYFSQGEGALVALWEVCRSWPPPIPGGSMQLPVGEWGVISARLPAFDALPPPRPPVDPTVVAALQRRASRAAASMGGSSSSNVRRSHSNLAPVSAPLAVTAGADADSTQLPGERAGSVELHPVFVALQSRLRAQDSLSSMGSAASLPGAVSALRLHESDSGALSDASAGSVSGGNKLEAADKAQPPQRSASLKRTGSSAGDASAAPGAFCEVDACAHLRGVMQHAWCLWEMMLVGEPLLVLAPTPGECSGAVVALVGLLAPLPYAADFRPYLVIHDPAARALCAGQGAPAGRGAPALLGVTNLYFVRSLQGSGVSVLAVGEREGAQQQPPRGSLLNPFNALRTIKRRQQGAAQLLTGHTQQLWTSYRPLTRPHHQLLSSWTTAPANAAPGGATAGRHLRQLQRHFHDLTTALLAPFTLFLEPSAPEEGGRVPRWAPEALMRGLAAPGGADPLVLLRVGGTTQALQQLLCRFIAGPHFWPWFSARRRPVEHLLEPEPVPVMPPGPRTSSNGGGRGSSGGTADVEVALVQAFVQAELQLQAARSAAPSGADSGYGHDAASTSELRAAQCGVVDTFLALPVDVCQTLLSSPLRRALLEELVAGMGDQEDALRQLLKGVG